MGIRRLTRLTKAFSRKWENHWAAVVVWFTFYNFCRVHRPLLVTPAMKAGIADNIWSVRELREAAQDLGDLTASLVTQRPLSPQMQPAAPARIELT